jgi:hypothetical protein
VPAGLEPAVPAGAPPGRRRKQRRRLHKRPRQAGHQGGTGHAWPPGQQLAAVSLAHRRQQPAPGGAERQPGPGPGRQLKTRHNVKPARAQVQDRHVGRRPGAAAAKRGSGLARASWKAASVPSALNTGLARSPETGTRPAGNSAGAAGRPVFRSMLSRVHVPSASGAAQPCRLTSRTWPAAPYQQFVAGYACTGTEQPARLGQSGQFPPGGRQRLHRRGPVLHRDRHRPRREDRRSRRHPHRSPATTPRDIARARCQDSGSHREPREIAACRLCASRRGHPRAG